MSGHHKRNRKGNLKATASLESLSVSCHLALRAEFNGTYFYGSVRRTATLERHLASRNFGS